MFLANVRLDWKVIASYKHSSLFGHIDSDKIKKLKGFTALTPVGIVVLAVVGILKRH